MKSQYLINRTSRAARIAFIQSCWHRDIIDHCRLSFISEIESAGYPASSIDFFEVPGAFEIPTRAKELQKTGRYAVVVAAGLVVDGEIYRHEFVAQSAVNPLMAAQLTTAVPVISIVLTSHHLHTNIGKGNFFAKHSVTKGAVAAQTCAATIDAVQRIASLNDRYVFLQSD